MEWEQAKRSAIRLIVEGDDDAKRHMVLCVTRVYSDSNQQAHIELTDGWYKIKGLLDRGLERALSRGRIRVGDKVSIMNAKAR